MVIHEPEWDMCPVLHCLIWTGVNNVLTGQTKATCSHIECGPQDRRKRSVLSPAEMTKKLVRQR